MEERQKDLKICVIALILFACVALSWILSPREAKAGFTTNDDVSHSTWDYNGKTWQYTDNEGWSIVAVQQAWDLSRVEKMEQALEQCPICMDQAEQAGEFKLLRRMKSEGYENFYAFAFDIPDDKGLIFDEHSSITLVGTTKDGLEVEVKSDQIIFCVGWGTLYQVEELINTEQPVYVKPIGAFQEPSSRDLEWIRFRSEGDHAGYYTLGYARFPEEVRNVRAIVNWQITDVTSFPIR